MARAPSLADYLKKYEPSPRDKHESKQSKKLIRDLQLQMVRIQQGIWHQRRRAVIVFEGFDGAGKGGAIRRLTDELEPRGFHVHPIGPPTSDEQGKHYLYRFWKRLPPAGTIAVFDRSWYGRVLVERVEQLCPPERVRAAFREINEFERMLVDDGVDVIKFFMAITPEEQLRRFEQRLNDPYKQWKLTEADVRARANWDEYVEATDEMFDRTHTHRAPWHLIGGDNKTRARESVLTLATERLRVHRVWMEKKARELEVRSLRTELERLERRNHR